MKKFIPIGFVILVLVLGAYMGKAFLLPKLKEEKPVQGFSKPAEEGSIGPVSESQESAPSSPQPQPSLQEKAKAPAPKPKPGLRDEIQPLAGPVSKPPPHFPQQGEKEVVRDEGESKAEPLIISVDLQRQLMQRYLEALEYLKE